MSDDAVGYGNPPKHSQFKKGQSGNPNGRPKKGENLYVIIEHVLDTKVMATINGKRQKIMKREAAAMTFVNKLLDGGVGIWNNYLASQRALGIVYTDDPPFEPQEPQPMVITLDMGDPEKQAAVAAASERHLKSQSGDAPEEES